MKIPYKFNSGTLLHHFNSLVPFSQNVKFNRYTYIYKRVHSLSHSFCHSLVQQGSGDFMENCVWNFGVSIVFETVSLLKLDFAKFYPLPFLKSRHQKHIFEHDPAPNYLTMRKLHMERLNLKTIKSFSPILDFFILRGIRWGEAQFR